MKVAHALLNEFRSGKGLKGQLLRGGFWSLGIKLLSTFMALVLAIVLARLLGAEGFGIYSYVFALISILAIPAQLGLPGLVVRETAKAQIAGNWGLMKGLWRWSTLVSLAMSALLVFIGGLCAWLIADNLGREHINTLWWGLLLIPLIALGNLRGAALRGLRKVVQGQLPEFVIRPALFVLLALGWSTVLGLNLRSVDAMMLHAIAGAVAFAIGAWQLRRESPVQLRDQMATSVEAKAWLASAMPLALIGGIQIVNQNVGIVILGLFRVPDEVGLLRVAMQGAALVAFGLTAANMVIAPHIARLYAQDDRIRLQRMITQSARLVLLMAIPPAVAFLLLGEEIITIVFGSEFSGANAALAILIAAQLFDAFTASVSTLLTMTGRERDVMSAAGISMAVNVFATITLAPSYGLIGAACASALSLVVWNALLWWRVRQSLGLDSTAVGISPVKTEK